jgi:hypothetical protein
MTLRPSEKHEVIGSGRLRMQPGVVAPSNGLFDIHPKLLG